YTDFVDKTLAFLRELVRTSDISLEQYVDFLGWLLRQIGRHLTAYDLVKFHHRGANYPDALLLDAVLKEYFHLIELEPGLFESGEASRVRRRALRQGCLLRVHYEGLPVPDHPSSPGENARVLPPPYDERIPDEQFVDPSQRTRKLYDADPLTAHLD